MNIKLKGLGCLGVAFLLLIILAVSIMLVPYLMLVVLTALGVNISFWVCCGIWILLLILINVIK